MLRLNADGECLIVAGPVRVQMRSSNSGRPADLTDSTAGSWHLALSADASCGRTLT
jgi:hypothetical protein